MFHHAFSNPNTLSNVEQIATNATQAMLGRLGIAVNEAEARQAVARNTQQEG